MHILWQPSSARRVDRAVPGRIGPAARKGDGADSAPRRHGGSGSVTLVGAGPGDPELLTLKAIRALQAADVVLFDDLVSPEVLEFVPAHAERIAVGKRAGRHSCRQEDINALMLRMARSGRRVVRLKS